MSDYDTQVRRAKTAMLSHDYETAVRIFKNLIGENPADIDLKMQLGNLYIKSGNDKDALAVFEDEQMPKNADVQLALGGIYRRLGRFDESIAVLKEAQSGGKIIQSSYSLGFTYRQMGRYDDAISCFQNVIDKNPRDVLSFNHLGAIYALQGDHEKAISAYKRGLKIDQNHPILQMNIAKSYDAMNETQKALSHYEAALRSKPGWTEAIEAYSDLLLKENHIKEADDVVSRTLKINPEDVKMHTAMGKIYNRQNIYESAEKEFKKALSKNDEYTPALTGLAFSQDKQGKHVEAAETIQKAGRLSPDDVSILKQTANILLSANYLPAAYEKISHLCEIDENDVETINLLGQYYICHGDDDKIESCFDKIEKIAPTYTDVYKNWGERYMQMGDEKNAEDYLKVAVHENPTDPEAMIQLAGLYEIQGKNDAALDLLSEANRLDEHNVASRRRAQSIEKKATRAPLPIQQSIYKSEDSTSAPKNEPEKDEIDSTPKEIFENLNEEPKNDDNPFDLDLDDVLEDGNKKSADETFESEEKEEIAPPQKIEKAEKAAEPKPEKNEEPESEEDLDFSSLSQNEDFGEIEDLLDEEGEVENDFDTLIDDDSPVDEDDEPESPMFVEEDVQSNDMLDEKIELPSEKEEDDRHKPKPISDENYLSLEKQIQQAKNAAENANRMADQAWRAAQFASDYAMDMKKSLDEKLDEKINEKIGDGLNEKIDNKLSETLDNFVTPPDSDLVEEEKTEESKAVETANDSKELNEADEMLKKAIETLPVIARAIEDKEVEREFGMSLNMFKKLREMLEFLPPTKKKQFMTSRNRLMLDYIIARLSGKPGLLATVTAFLNSGLLSPRPTPTEEITSDLMLDPSNDGEVIELVSSVMETLRKLCENLQDDYLRDAIDTEILKLLEKIKSSI